MKKKFTFSTLALAVLLLAAGVFQPAAASAQGTAFAYQGRLDNGANPATGSYDLRFALFDAATAGTQQGTLLTNSATAVSNGLFTVTLDFGSQFPGAPRWLEIGVRSNGVAAFSELTPRQQLTPVPYAVFAESANATNLMGTVQSANLAGVAMLNANQTFTGGNTFNGSVGIGTPPAGSVPLSVQGNSSVGDGVIEAYQNGGATTGYGVAGYSLLPGGRGVIGEADTESPNVTGPGASNIGVTGVSFGTNGTGVFGFAGASTGVNYGVVGQTFSPQGYAGYFLGQSYFGGSVGIGTTSPAKQLDLTGTASGVATGTSIDSSIFMRVNNTASDGNTLAPDFAGIGFGHNSTRQAIVGGTFGNDFLDFYTGGSLTAPKMRIDINGTVGIMTNDVLELGYGVAGKESNAGKIGYEKFTPDSLDIVGAGTNGSSRKIKFWAEGGATFSGNVTATSFAGSFAGSGTGLTNVAHLSGGNNFTGQQTLTNAFFGYVHSDGTREVGTYLDANGGWFGTITDDPLLFYVNNGFASMAIATSGNVGIGTVTPAGHLSVATAQGTVNIMDGQFTPELVMTGGAAPGVLRVRNSLEIWPNTNATAAGKVDVRGTNGVASILLDGSNGNVTCVAVNITSDRNAKESVSPINVRAVLDRVASLPISEWQYKQQSAVRHIGPMAQDFSSAFSLGADDKHISIVDESGVALAAIQGLNQKLDEKDARIKELEKSMAELKELVGKLTGQQDGGAK